MQLHGSGSLDVRQSLVAFALLLICSCGPSVTQRRESLVIPSGTEFGVHVVETVRGHVCIEHLVFAERHVLGEVKSPMRLIWMGSLQFEAGASGAGCAQLLSQGSAEAGSVRLHPFLIQMPDKRQYRMTRQLAKVIVDAVDRAERMGRRCPEHSSFRIIMDMPHQIPDDN